MAEEYSVRPSVLLGLTDPYEMYCMDSAVNTWGNHVDNRLNEYAKSLYGDGKKKVDEKIVRHKLSLKFRQLLGDNPDPAKQEFASPPPPPL